MKKEFFLGVLGLALVLLFINGCLPVTKYYVCADGRQVLDPAKCPVIEEEEEQEPEAGEDEVVLIEVEEEEEEIEDYDIFISDEAQALFDKLDKVMSLQYSYVESPDVLPENTYYTSREKMKINLDSKVRFTEKESYDTVYLDLVKKTSVAYCENRDRGTCPDKDKPFRADFDDYFIETPFDWAAKITKAELTGRSQTLENRNALEVSFEIKGKPGVMFVDSFFGIPLKMTFNDKVYEFRDMATQINLEQLDHQFEE
ncbi:hypothetical protein KY348_04855 [Candidatus Woesearchaeota archaeon]|nr:hypothetical protein [Candidatus Woesearchaeota archaeon]